ncbi:MAG: tetratricopeptide repeat protein [Bacteroides sp.]|nr:tetratricopeptide repeat protein [Bacteroides sp.]
MTISTGLKYLTLTISLFVTAMVSHASAISQNEVGESAYMTKVGEADKACAEGKWDEAEKALMAAMDCEPDNPNNVLLLSNLGIIRYNMGQDSLAITTLNIAHRKAPSSVTILANRAKIFAANGYEENAYQDYDRILRLDSMEITSRLSHCLLALRRHSFREAVNDFEFMKCNFPDKMETEIAGASVLSGTGDYAGAIPYYTRILKERNDWEYYSGRGFCYLLTGAIQEAADDINTAISLEPDYGELYLYRAALNKMRYRPDDAEADAKRAINLGVDKARAKQFLSKPFPIQHK